jgi:2'-hydroxyisoflavone reductase
VRLLVLGGTKLVGRGLAAAALAAGHEVTLFHRGVTGLDVHPGAEHLLGDRDGGLDPLVGRTWDACVDVSGYEPRLVRASAEVLAGSVERFVYVSTISVYASLATPMDELAPLAALPDGVDPDEFAWEHYGALKALGEQAATRVFGDRATVVRPGYVVGPHDHTGRFTWWVRRAARGGRMPVPASIYERAQFIDGRDLGTFLLRAAEDGLPGAYNATGPVPSVGMGEVLGLAADLADAPLEVVPVPDDRVAAAGVELPLWPGTDPAWASWAEVDVTRALAAGLTFRPLAETVRDVLADAPEVADLGPAQEAEERLLGG